MNKNAKYSIVFFQENIDLFKLKTLKVAKKTGNRKLVKYAYRAPDFDALAYEIRNCRFLDQITQLTSKKLDIATDFNQS